MFKFFFNDQGCALLTLCGVLGLLMALGLPPLQNYHYSEVMPHVIYWSTLPINGFIGLCMNHRERKKLVLRETFAKPHNEPHALVVGISFIRYVR